MEKQVGEEREREKSAENEGRYSAPTRPLMMMSFSAENLTDDLSKRKISRVSPQQTQGFPHKSRKLRGTHTSVVKLKDLVDDGYGWRKYGQKDILGARFPREYYRCTYRDEQGCFATKLVQRVNEANAYEVTYRGRHTCHTRTSITAESIGEASNKQLSFGSFSINEYWGPRDRTSLSSSFTEQGDFSSCEREADMSGSEIQNAALSSDIRQGESTISAKTAHKESDKSALSANHKTAKVSRNTISILDSSHSPNVVDNLGGSKVLGNSLSGSSVKSSKSTEGTLHRLLVASQDVQAKKIGIYGTGGIGKTTVLKAFFSHCVMKGLFDFVLWVSVSRCSSRRKIQNALVQQLALNVPTFKSEDEVAVILLQTLQSKNFVLLLDDVWYHIDLPKVGIPIPSQDNNYRIILTTRSLSVCHAMEVDRTIKAEALSREEALKLFRVHVGDVMDSQDINPYARTIVEECFGLPLTIKVVARALKMDNNVLTWKLALKEVLLTNNFRILRLGYDMLKIRDMKSCFLYSALFTEGKAIRYSSLLEYLLEEGFVEGSMPVARRRGHAIINYLVDASLLECSDDGSMVKMHDIIRDLALMILHADAEGLQLLLSRYFRTTDSLKAHPLDLCGPTVEVPANIEKEKSSPSEGNQSVLTSSEGLNELPAKNKWEESRIACLVESNVSSLPMSSTCSKLLALFLQRNCSLRAIPPSFFDNMSSLKILNLSKTRIKSLPQSLSKLESLQVLVMRNCDRLLFLPPAIGALKRLLVLDLHGTEICQLPDEIGELHRLTHLNVNLYGTIDQDEYGMLPSQLISKGIISKLSELKELSIIVHPVDARWSKSLSDLIKEVSSLKLCTLSFHFPETKYLECFTNESSAWALRTLTRFNFVVGHNVKRIVSHVADDIEQDFDQQDRCLRFVDSEYIPDAVREVLSEVTAFYLDHHLKAHSLTQFGCSNINKLKFCIVRDCPQLKAILNCKVLKGSCFPYLEHLSIHYSWDLRRIWVGPVRAGSFAMLRRLVVHSCPRLEFILSQSMVAALSSLEELVVEDCQSLKNVLIHQDQSSFNDDMFDGDCAESSIDISDNLEDDTNVPKEDDAPAGSAVLGIKVLKLLYLPQLENIWNGGNFPFLEYLSLYNCPSLRKLHLKSEADMATLKEIKAETAWWDALEWENPALREKLEGRVKEINVDDIWGKM